MMLAENAIRMKRTDTMPDIDFRTDSAACAVA